MSQHDYEKQPEAPDLGAAVQLDTSETLEGPIGDVDGLDAGYSPPDRPYVLDDDDITVAGQRRSETLDERLARDEPEEVPVDGDRAGRLSDPDQGAALEGGDAMTAVDVGIDGGAAPAEEAAMHVIDLEADPDTDPDAEGGQAPWDDPEVGLPGDDPLSRRRGSGRTGMEPDPAYPHGGERDPALPDPPER
jgi:hypothetical protein